MPTWEAQIRKDAAAVVGVDPIEEIDDQRKVVVIKSDISDPPTLRAIEKIVKEVGYEVKQL